VTDNLERETRKAARAERRWKVYTVIATTAVAIPLVLGCAAAVAILVIW
jgi:hypothetical protein